MTTARQQALADVDAQIQRHRDEIRNLESKRNTLVPISQLPAEILCRIFQFVQPEASDKPPPQDDATSDSSSGIEWVKITHVSRHWREVAIDQASLWTSPPMHHTKWAIEMLKRSRTAPVRIMLDASTVRGGSGLFSAITSHMSHVAIFNVWKASGAFLREFFHSLPETMPLLEEISVNVHLIAQGGPEHTPVLGHDNEQLLTIPDSIYRRAPALRRLQLVKVAINWDLPSLSSLTTLALLFSAPPTLAQLRSTLESMPNLETLTLQNTLPRPSRPDTPHQKPITLSKLKKLTVGGDPDQVACFFTHFATPNVKNVNSSFIHEEGGYDLPWILSTIKHPYARPSPGPRSLLFFFHRLFLSQIGMAESESLYPALNLKIIAMDYLTYPASSRQTDRLMTQLFDGFNWLRLHDVNFSRIPVSADVLARTFGTLPSLEKISVGAQSVLPLIDALQQGADIDPALDPTSVVFPGLREVVMQEVPFFTGYPPESEELDANDLRDCLMSRHERGVGIHRLTLNKCLEVDEETVELLQEIVVEVDWDYVAIDTDEEEEVVVCDSSEESLDDDSD